MGMCTYLGEKEFTAPTSDKELNSLLAEVRSATGKDWRIAERRIVSGRFRKRVTSAFELMMCIGFSEFQIINFYRPERANEWLPSINTLSSASLVAAYLYGVLGGCKKRTGAT